MEHKKRYIITDAFIAKHKTVSRKQVISYGWYVRLGGAFSYDGMERVGDRIQGLWARFSPRSEKNKFGGQLVKVRPYFYPWIFFSIGHKSYKTPL